MEAAGTPESCGRRPLLAPSIVVALFLLSTPMEGLAQRGRIIGHVVRLERHLVETGSFTPPTVRDAPRAQDVQYVVVYIPTNLAGNDSDPLGLVPGGGVRSSNDYLLHLKSRGGLGGGTMELGVYGSVSEGQALAGPVVVEPVRLDARAALRVERDLARSFPRGPETIALDAYCLERLKVVPSAGLIFRVADPEIQRRHGDALRALSAARRARALDRLTPDSDPSEYFHSIAQWAIWSVEDDLDESRFTEAFLEHTKKNLEEGGIEWSGEIERQVRALIPNRWKDVMGILADAAPDRGEGDR